MVRPALRTGRRAPSASAGACDGRGGFVFSGFGMLLPRKSACSARSTPSRRFSDDFSVFLPVVFPPLCPRRPRPTDSPPFFSVFPAFPRSGGMVRPARRMGRRAPSASVGASDGRGASFFPASACCCPGKVQVPPAVPPPAVFPTIFRCFSLSCSRRSVHGGLAPPFSRRFLRLVPFFRRERGQFVSHTLQRLMPEYFPARRGHPYQAIFLIATPGIFRRAGAPHSTMQNL